MAYLNKRLIQRLVNHVYNKTGLENNWMKTWSGRRDSNPRPSPWQGDALPAEPRPQNVFINTLSNHRVSYQTSLEKKALKIKLPIKYISIAIYYK